MVRSVPNPLVVPAQAGTQAGAIGGFAANAVNAWNDAAPGSALLAVVASKEDAAKAGPRPPPG
jgi:hypothetical protein